ncbi:MAG: DUF4150 domain-containing protein [Phycisphaerae bacterium]|nr:DUF4150 domain-containing protein [Phycisphaerae bacterium]
MGLPVATKAGGICFAFPDVCNTPAPPAPPIPIPYPNIGQLSDATGVSTDVKVGGNLVILKGSIIKNTTGDEAGSVGGVLSGSIVGKVEFETASETVKINGDKVVRMTDKTKQNNRNADGTVLGGVANVLCGG